MKSQILLAAMAAFSLNVFAQDSGTPVRPAQGEIKQEKEALKEKRQERNQAEKAVKDDKAQLAKDKAGGAAASQIDSDKAKLKQDRKVRNEKQKEVRKERQELRQDVREKRAAKHE